MSKSDPQIGFKSNFFPHKFLESAADSIQLLHHSQVIVKLNWRQKKGYLSKKKKKIQLHTSTLFMNIKIGLGLDM